MQKKESSNDMLQQMYKDFQNQKNELLNLVEKNENRIKEIDRYLQSLFEKEDFDYKVFSPRKIENIYKDRILEEKKQKAKIENDNQNLYKKIAFFIDKMEKIEAVIFVMEENHLVSSGTTTETNMILLEMQERDRQRIARDLHDIVVQNLVHLLHKVELATKFVEQDVIRAKLELCSVNLVIKDSINDLRNIIFNLRPMDIEDLGLLAALDGLCDSLRSKAKPNLFIQFELKEVGEATETVLLSVYRIIQECCTNAMKHADAEKLDVKLYANESMIKIEIKDNGKGFDTKIEREAVNSSFGLKMIEERLNLLNGTMQIHSRLHEGTLVEIEIPKQTKGQKNEY